MDSYQKMIEQQTSLLSSSSRSVDQINSMLPVISTPLRQQSHADHESDSFEKNSSNDSYDASNPSHRTSCHRCGNVRKKKTLCRKCPHVFCARCTEKMFDEHGKDIFDDGCPVVRYLLPNSFISFSAKKNVVVEGIKLLDAQEKSV